MRLFNDSKNDPLDNNYFLSVIESPWYRAISHLQDLISTATTDFYRSRRMQTLHLPVTTGSISSPMGAGSDSLPVKVELFGIDTYLADSMQFMLEFGCRLCNRGVYYIMPSFRGESVDKRHLSQFFHSEVEIVGEASEVRKLAEEYLSYICRALLENAEAVGHVRKWAGRLSHLEKRANNGSIAAISMKEATTILDSKYIETIQETGARKLSSAGERALMGMFNGIVWLLDHEHLSVPFYQARYFDNGIWYAKNGDLLFGIGEVFGSGERHATAEDVFSSLRDHGVSHDSYSWYTTMKEKYPMRTSGFGMGIERLLLWILDHDDIRNCQILPRENGKQIIP